MLYLSYERLQGVQNHMVVDTYGTSPLCVLELSHWPGNRTPNAFRRDTSTESVVAWVEAGGHDSVLEIQAVSNDHYDLDGLLAIWAATNPDALGAHRDALVGVATTEDFDRFVSEQDLRITLELLAAEQLVTAASAGRDTDTNAFTARLYNCLLPEVQRCLSGRFQLEAEWAEEFREVMRSLELLEGRLGGCVDEYPDIDLAVVVSDRPFHPFAVHAITTCTRLLTLVQGQRPTIYYRYESFVDYVSRSVPPRVPLKPLAALLNRSERCGVWVGEGMLAAHPRVQLFASDGSVTISSFAADNLIRTVVDYFRDAVIDPSTHWRPGDGLRAGPELDLLPIAIDPDAR